MKFEIYRKLDTEVQLHMNLLLQGPWKVFQLFAVASILRPECRKDLSTFVY